MVKPRAVRYVESSMSIFRYIESSMSIIRYIGLSIYRNLRCDIQHYCRRSKISNFRYFDIELSIFDISNIRYFDMISNSIVDGVDRNVDGGRSRVLRGYFILFVYPCKIVFFYPLCEIEIFYPPLVRLIFFFCPRDI